MQRGTYVHINLTASVGNLSISYLSGHQSSFTKSPVSNQCFWMVNKIETWLESGSLYDRGLLTVYKQCVFHL